MKIFGALPDIVLNISDQRLLMLMKLLFSIPTPKPDEEVAIETDNADAKFDMKLKDRAKMRAIMEVSSSSPSYTLRFRSLKWMKKPWPRPRVEKPRSQRRIMSSK